MLGCKSTAYGDALGCGVGYRAAPSAYFLPQPGRYLAAEGAVLAKTNCPTSAGLAPPGHRMARKRLQSAPPAGTQAVGRCQLLFMYRVSVGFFRWADFGCLARRSWLEPKMAYTHLLTQQKSPLLPSLAPLGAVWHLVGLTWAPGGGCPTPPISATRTPLQALGQPPPEKPLYTLSIAW